MFSARNFSTLKIFEDPAEMEGGNDYTKLRTFQIRIDGTNRNFIGSYGINERLAGPNGIMNPTYQSIQEPAVLFFFWESAIVIVTVQQPGLSKRMGGPFGLRNPKL